MNLRHSVVLCADRNMIVPAAFVADSVLRLARTSGRAFDVIIVTDEMAVTPCEADWLVRRGIEHQLADFSELKKVFGQNDRLTTATLVKLILPELLGTRHERILYLDCDLTIHADLSPLFALELGDMPLAANQRGAVFSNDQLKRSAETHFEELGMTRPFRYFNSGVMLIDVANWTRENVGRRTLDFIAANKDLCELPDEDGLNAVLNGRFANLSPIWNMNPRRGPFMPLHARHQSAIVHYSGPDKPWKRFGAGKPLFPDMQAYRLYEAFLADSPWPRWLAAQWTWQDIAYGIGSAGAARLKARGRPVHGADAGYPERFAEFLGTTRFIDIEQGLTSLTDGRLRLRS